MTADQELRASLERLSHAFDALQVPWAIGGSFASTVHGEPRATNDLDVTYMREVSATGNLTELLDRALLEGGR